MPLIRELIDISAATSRLRSSAPADWIADVLARNRVEGAVAPAIERPPPHQPVRRIRILQHRVGDRDEVPALRPAGRLGRDDQRRACQCRQAGPRYRRPS